ncbi:hypothetical protein CERZMDRAFT_44896 [Cercospora zeae-maydis SCOH1-5]|uniref:DUF7918 domain-containing protein n=1 Tax=Cercospora zeae-maydis SCOH1-5 TaxID=717836 RepID=A0A6A6FAZ9_9PEZI|nr:hypothetical protein CERZMDRAFT_44896 [Cercospora zeae-maydis SCOH1-5]
MPCFKGLAVSIHTADGPIAEHSIQKQTRQSRITTYIPVPPAKVPSGSTSGKPEQSTFAISITLLTPGLNVPYSTPKATIEDPYPRPRIVGNLPGEGSERGKYQASVPPYVPRTDNPNETIAAYIYFDGRAKEEVATLLRRGEETWVNSRWVSVPESEGGGLAEREFLFREVGLERWLNGLDLEGTDQAKKERIERRQKRLEKKRRKTKEEKGSDDEDVKPNIMRRNGVLRYGGEDGPVEEMQDDDGLFSSNSDSEDDPPEPEAAGQIKVALFRVLASGEIKRGEYSPQFDAHDDDMEGGGDAGGGEDVDHTTSFAKPKTLDPKTISTQTVTGLDPPESPYAVFTFFYRGEKQLRKMGILSTPASERTPQSSGRRKSSVTDFSKLGPLKSQGTKGFSGYRDSTTAKRKGNEKDVDAMDSDADEEEDERLPDGNDDTDAKQENGNTHLSPEDAKRTNEVAEGVQKIKLKRQHSADPVGDPSASRKSPHVKSEESTDAGTPQSVNSVAANAGTPPNGLAPPAMDGPDVVASPFKRQRASMPGLNNGMFTSEAGFLPSTSASAPKDAERPKAKSTPEVKPNASKEDEAIDEDL